MKLHRPKGSWFVVEPVPNAECPHVFYPRNEVYCGHDANYNKPCEADACPIREKVAPSAADESKEKG